MASFDVDEVLAKLSTSQKIALLTGLDFWHTVPIPEHNVPKIRLSDGSSGIRGTRWFEGVRGAALPCGTAFAATWDRYLIREAGELLGNECKAKGVHCWLGPTINIQRSPLGGRGYESYSEDPYLTGVLASEVIQGCESTGVIATIKHFICNDQEDEKCALNAVMTERALREIYLRPFQIAARDAKPGALMASYNKVNGVHVSETKRLLTDIVRREWGWNPLIMSDWLGTYSTVDALNAGLDLEMPGETMLRGRIAELALATRLVSLSTMDDRARRVLEFIRQASGIDVSRVEGERNTSEDKAVNLAIAQNSIVLLKNEKETLPLPKTAKKVALIGSHMKDAEMYSTGATALEPYYTIHPLDAIKAKLAATTEVVYEVGAYTHRMLPVLNTRLSDDMRLVLFNESPEDGARQPIDSISMRKAFFQLLDYEIPNLKSDTFYGQLLADFTPDETGTWQFGVTVHGTARLYVDDKLVVDNATTQRAGTAFFSQGTKEELGSVQLNAGTSYKLRVEFGSALTSNLQNDTGGGVSFNGGGLRVGALLQLDAEQAIQNAVKAAEGADYAVICTGLNGEWESEGFDRENMDMPAHVRPMIERVAAVCPRTVVVNRTGMPVTMRWADKVPSIVQAWYGGNESGSSIADVLFGDFNPCGKMPISWPHELRDNPTYLNWGSTKGRVLFGEDVYVGYRWYDKIGRPAQWSFGHGLSYTTFSLSDLRVSVDIDTVAGDERPRITASIMVKNTGTRAGAEIAQLFVEPIEPRTNRPVRELHGFQKIWLEPGEERRIDLSADKYAMSFWDESQDRWCIEKGQYAVRIRGTPTGLSDVSEIEGTIDVAETVTWLGI